MYIQPGKTVMQCSSSLEEQLDECLHSIKKSLAACGLETRDILKQTVFLKSADNNDFYIQKRELSTLLKDFYQSFYPDRGMVYTIGITPGKNTAGILQQSKDAFMLMKRVLEKESMDFSHIVRQWNYIENITGKIDNKDETRQNYQVFNDIRSLYYGEVPSLNLVSDICRENLQVEIEGAIALPALSQER